MKNFIIDLSVRLLFGYLGIVVLSYKFSGIYQYLIYLASDHPVFMIMTIFLTLTSIESGFNWIKINLQLKGVGGKSRYQAKSLSKEE